MEGSKIHAIDWGKIPDGRTLSMRDFPSTTLLKLNNKKGLYTNYRNDSILVDIKEHKSNENGNYYVFQTCEDDWHPLTNRLWKND